MPVIASIGGRAGAPVSSTYRKPWNVKRGCQVSVAPPRQMYVSVASAPRRLAV